MTAFAHNPMALPSLSRAIPTTYTVDGGELWCAPLAKALLEIGMITDADFAPPSALLTDVFAPVDEISLIERALTRWWAAHTSGLSVFRWSLSVRSIDVYGHPELDDPWFCVSVCDGIPQFSLALRVEELEAELEGFGQTVMALLWDALRYLPESFTPLSVLWLAEFTYWNGHPNEDEFIEDQLAYSDYATKEDYLRENEVFTLAEFYRHMPQWLPLAKRVRSREELERAACSTLGQQVIAACDRIWSLVRSAKFRRHAQQHFAPDVRDLQADPVVGCVLLRWSEQDESIRILDDALDQFYNSGKFTDFIAANQIPIDGTALRAYFHNMENMLALAAAVERLILLIGQPSHQEIQ